MKKYVQTFLRHKFVLVAPIVIALALGIALASTTPQKWMSGSTLFADSSVPNDSTILEAPAQVTPAAIQAGLLSELLSTKAFLGQVAIRSGAVKAQPVEQIDDNVLGTIRGRITVATPGPHVVSVFVLHSTPKAAADLNQAVVDEYLDELHNTLTQRAEALAAYNNERVATATAATAQAQQELDDYLVTHPQFSGPRSEDPTATQLSATVVSARDQLAKAQDAANAAELQVKTVDTASNIRIVDKPSTPTLPQSRKSGYIVTAGGALVGGVLISGMLLLFMVATDRSAREPGDVEEELGLQVIGSIGQSSSRRRALRKARAS